VIGTIGRTTGVRKLVKNLKYTKKGLVVGALDQFVMKFWGIHQSMERLKLLAIHSLQQNLPILNAVLANVGSPV